MRFTAVTVTAMALVLLAIAGPVSAQTPPQERIDDALAHAAEAGIPVTLLEDKIAEGKAKGVSLDRIATAVERRADAIARAQEAMKSGEAATSGELTVAADAVESGVSEAVLKAVAESAPRDRRAVAIAALTELVQLGHVPERALLQVQEALKRGPEALLNLPAAAGRRGGGPPAQLPDAATGAGAAAGGPPAGVPVGGQAQPGRPDGAGPPAGRGGGQ